MKKKIKLFDPTIGKDEKQKIFQVLESGFWASGSGIGYVSTFEKKSESPAKVLQALQESIKNHEIQILQQNPYVINDS